MRYFKVDIASWLSKDEITSSRSVTAPAQPWQEVAFRGAVFEQINLRTCRPHPRLRSGYSATRSLIPRFVRQKLTQV